MDKHPDFLPVLAEKNGKFSHAPSGNPNAADAVDDKWDLGWVIAVFKRQALLMAQVALGSTLLAGGLMLLLTRATPSQYAGKFQLLVEPITAEEQQARSSTRAQGASIPDAQQINVNQSSLDYESQIRILQGPRLLEPVVAQIQQRYPDVTYETLTRDLKIERLITLTSDKKEQGTKLIEVTYEDSDIEKIKYILDRVSEAYLNYSLKERQSTLRRGIQFIDTQLSPLRQRVDVLQRQIQTLRQNYAIVDPVLQGQQLTEAAGRLEQIEAENQTQLAEVTARRNAMVRQLQGASPQSVLGETTYYQTLLSQYQQIEGQIATESARLRPDNPAMQALLEKQRNLQSLLNREAGQVINKVTDSIVVADARRQAINQAQAEINQQIQQLSSIARRYTDLQRELSLATDSLNKFAARQEALQIDAAQQEIPWELTISPRLILNEAGQPAKVDSVSKVQLLLLIAVLSILLGVGVGFLVEVSRDVLHSTDEVKQVSRLPVLGAIPHNKAPLGSASPEMTEAFRSLSKNLRLLSKSYGPMRSIAITSAEIGEGKSTVAVHLAMSAATLDHRVLLIDTDLRHPSVHERLGLPNHQGLSDLLQGKEDWQSVLQSTSNPNLTVLTAGDLALDPVELLTPYRVEPVLQKLQTMFDLLILDTPPLLGLADSGLIVAQCDAIGLVVRLGKTSRPSISAALEELKFSSTTVLGVIANDAPENASLPQRYYSLARQF